MIIGKIKKIVENPQRLILYAAGNRLFNWMSDEIYIKMIYRLRIGKKLDLKNPASFNEKLQWLKLYDRKSEYIQYVDKYEVRKHIAESIGDEYLIPLIGVYDKPEEIDFDLLPDQFVLKCTHDSGGIIICNDKSQLDIKATIKKLNKCLKRNYYFHGREWPYKNVKPRIICEKFMVDESDIELKDYKLFCFNGEPKLIEVDFNRFTEHKRNLYTTNWEYIDACIKYPNQSSYIVPKPKKIDDIIRCAKVLSKNIAHVRIDFYSINERIYFGEMTFFHESGFEKFTPESYDYLLGSWITLPSRTVN